MNATKETKSEVAEPIGRNPFLPVSLEERAKEKARIREEQLARLPRMLDCLDPTVAKTYEDRKPLWEWKVECRMFRAAVGKTPARMETIEKNVVAQNERDAWAMFCDSIGEWPSIRGARPAITRLKKRTLRDAAELSETES